MAISIPSSATVSGAGKASSIITCARSTGWFLGPQPPLDWLTNCNMPELLKSQGVACSEGLT